MRRGIAPIAPHLGAGRQTRIGKARMDPGPNPTRNPIKTKARALGLRNEFGNEGSVPRRNLNHSPPRGNVRPSRNAFRGGHAAERGGERTQATNTDLLGMRLSSLTDAAPVRMRNATAFFSAGAALRIRAGPGAPVAPGAPGEMRGVRWGAGNARCQRWPRFGMRVPRLIRRRMRRCGQNGPVIGARTAAQNPAGAARGGAAGGLRGGAIRGGVPIPGGRNVLQARGGRNAMRGARTSSRGRVGRRPREGGGAAARRDPPIWHRERATGRPPRRRNAGARSGLPERRNS